MTRALILAAGQGTRLRPITNDIPKCLVPLMGKSLLQRQVETLRSCGVDSIHIVAGYKAEKISSLGYATTINTRFSTTNMVSSLFSAADYFDQDCDLIIAYGDIVYQEENLQALLNCNDDIALMIDSNWRDLWSLRLENPLDDAETLVIDSSGYITELGRKPDSYERIQGQYTGLIKIRSDKIKSLLAFYQGLDRSATYDGNNFDNMYMTSFLQLLINSGWQTKAVMVNGGWLEIDSVEDLKAYEELGKQGELDQYYRAST